MPDYPDDVRRVKDALDLHAVAGNAGKYIACRLDDGRPVTHDCYSSRGEARRFAERKTTTPLLIVQVQPDGAPLNEVAAVLKYERGLWAAGWRTPDTLETEENSGLLSMPRTKADRKRMARQLLSGRPLYPSHVPYGNLPHQKGK